MTNATQAALRPIKSHRQPLCRPTKPRTRSNALRCAAGAPRLLFKDLITRAHRPIITALTTAYSNAAPGFTRLGEQRFRSPTTHLANRSHTEQRAANYLNTTRPALANHTVRVRLLRTPARLTHTTVSRGPMARKKLSRLQYGCYRRRIRVSFVAQATIGTVCDGRVRPRHLLPTITSFCRRTRGPRSARLTALRALQPVLRAVSTPPAYSSERVRYASLTRSGMIFVRL